MYVFVSLHVFVLLCSVPCGDCRAVPVRGEDLESLEGFLEYTSEDDDACFFYMCNGTCPDGTTCHSCDAPQGRVVTMSDDGE